MNWFGVRSVYRHEPQEGSDDVYEERVGLFIADNVDEAIAKAELEAADYVDGLAAEVLSLFQCYAMFDDPGDGGEVFSLM